MIIAMAPSQTVGRLDNQTIGQLDSVEVHYSTYVRIFADSFAAGRIRGFAAPQAAIGVRKTAFLWPKCAIVKSIKTVDSRVSIPSGRHTSAHPTGRPIKTQVGIGQSVHLARKHSATALHNRTFWPARWHSIDTSMPPPPPKSWRPCCLNQPTCHGRLPAGDAGSHGRCNIPMR